MNAFRPKSGLVPLIVCLGVFECVGATSFAGTRAAFTEEAVLRGINYTPNQAQMFGDGLAFVDLDGDGDADVVVIGEEFGAVGVYENDGTGFYTDRSGGSGIAAMLDAASVTAGDYDRDGDLDLFISRRNRLNALLRNNGNFQFEDVSAAAGIVDTLYSYGCGWADYDNDGWLDLYVSNRAGFIGDVAPNRLYRNLGNGTFTDVAAALGVERTDASFQGSFFDFDRDGDADLYIATDHGEKCGTSGRRNHLYENLGGTFVDITDSSGTEACLDAMCVAIGDFDGNRFQDLYSTNTPPGNALMTNQGDGTFLREEIPAGVASFATGWGSVFGDFDNDGNLDLYVCNMDAPNRLYSNGGVWPCVDDATAYGLDDAGMSFSAAAADIDGDGDLDLLTMNRNQTIRLFINHEGESRRWSRFDVVGEGPNRFAVGANVDVRTGTTWRIREVIAGDTYLTQSELILHFGLNTALVMDEIQVMWPGGTTRTLFNLPTNQTWTLYPPDRLGDGDLDGDHDLDDFVVLVGCRPGGLDSAVQPGCEMMDYDGDGDIDQTDIDSFLAEYTGPIDDCDSNGTDDILEILLDPSLDSDGDGILDVCTANLPTATEWGVAVLSLLLLSAGSLVFGHRRTTRAAA